MSKSQDKILSRDYKRTQQEVSNILLLYLYSLQMVCTSNKYSCPNVYVSTINVSYIPYEINMLLIYIIILFFLFLLLRSRSITSYHVICHMIIVTCLFIVIEKKNKVK